MNKLTPKERAVVDHVGAIASARLLPLSGISFQQFLLEHRRFPIIAVTGQAGVGKTTFTDLLVEHLTTAVQQDPRLITPPTVRKLVELPQMSPYLAAIKASGDGLGQEVWEKNQQLFRILDESIIEKAVLESKDSIIVMDFSIIQVLVFAFLKVHGRSGKKFTQEFDAMFHKLPKPDFIVQIESDPDTVLARLETRGTYIDEELETVTHELNHYYSSKERNIVGEYYRNTPIISLDTTHMNLRDNTTDQSAATKQAVNDVIARIAA